MPKPPKQMYDYIESKNLDHWGIGKDAKKCKDIYDGCNYCKYTGEHTLIVDPVPYPEPEVLYE